MAGNPTLDSIRERRSVRNFTTAPVTDQQLEAVLEAGRWAPSARNSQPWDFVVVRDPQVRSAIGDILRRVTHAWKGLATAPVMIVVSVDPLRDPEHFVEDGAAAAQNLCLAAQSQGLASSWAGVYNRRPSRGSVESSLKKLLCLPRGHRIIAVVPIGTAKYENRGTRLPLAEIVHHDRFRSSPASRSEEHRSEPTQYLDESHLLPRRQRRRSLTEPVRFR
jgi:nitroreductase